MQKLACTTVGLLGLMALAACGDDTEGSGGSGQGGAGGGATTTTSTSSSDGGGGGSTSDGGGGSTSDGGGGAGGGEGGGGGSAASAWVKYVESPANLAGLHTTSDGGVVVVFRFFGTKDFGGGAVTAVASGSFLVAKYASDGSHVWSKQIDPSAVAVINHTALGPNDVVYLTGRTQGTVDFGGGALAASSTDAFIASYDASGDHRWSKMLGGTGYDEGRRLATNAAGDVLLTGIVNGAVNLGGGALNASGTDAFFVLFDATGAHQSSLLFDDSGALANDSVNVGGAALDASRNIYLTGALRGTLTLGGLTSAGGTDVFLVKLASSGNILWGKRFGDTSGQGGSSVVLDATGKPTLVASFSGTVDFGGGTLTSALDTATNVAVARFDDQGNHLASRGFGNMYDVGATQTKIRGDGAILLAGSTVSSFTVDTIDLSSPGFDNNSFWLLLGPNDGALAGATYTSTETNLVFGADFGPDETVYVGGWHLGELSIGAETVPAPGSVYGSYWTRQPITP